MAVIRRFPSKAKPCPVSSPVTVHLSVRIERRHAPGAKIKHVRPAAAAPDSGAVSGNRARRRIQKRILLRPHVRDVGRLFPPFPDHRESSPRDGQCSAAATVFSSPNSPPPPGLACPPLL